MTASSRLLRSRVSNKRIAQPACRLQLTGRVPNPSASPRTSAHVVVRASEAQAESSTTGPPAPQPEDGDWVSVLAPEELPKGVRKEVRVNGASVLLFWYRNQIYAIDARSPAEGAYSEGFIKAKFTQDYGIECPTTGSTFSLKDGSIISWYPTNPVLRSVTPKTSGMKVYPVKLTQDAIQIAVPDSAPVASTRGGADSSLENNNVFAIQPPVYVEGSDAEEPVAPVNVSTVATFSVAIAAFAIIAVAGTATCLYFEDFTLLGGFWLVMLGFGGYFVYQYNQNKSAA